MPVRLPSVNDLDSSQKSVVNHTPYDDPMFINGPPGSGKTHIAILRLNMLLNNGYTNILFLLYNHSMFGFLSVIFKRMGLRNNIKIDTKDIYFKRLAEGNGYTEFNRFDPYDVGYSKILNYLKVNSNLPKFDVILVDECQDFSIDEMNILKRMTPKIIAIGDLDQSVYGVHSGDFFRSLTNIKLSTIYRYGRKVAAIAEHFSTRSESLTNQVTSNDKTDVYKVTVNGTSDAVDKIARLINAKKSTDMSIAILSITNRQLEELSQRLTNAGVKHFYCKSNNQMRDYDFEQNVPILLTPFSAKGMEFDCVILYDYTESIFNWGPFAERWKEINYVSLTRTCKELYMINDNNTLRQLKNLSEWVELNQTDQKKNYTSEF